MLPALVMRHVLEALQTASDAPFHLNEVAGLIVLNAAPDFTEIEQDLLAAVSVFTPVHQLLNSGSFRLGYHGAYLVDEQPCTTETLPGWLPSMRFGPARLWRGRRTSDGNAGRK